MILPLEHTFRKFDELLRELISPRKNPLLRLAVSDKVMRSGPSTFVGWINSENCFRPHNLINRFACCPETAGECCQPPLGKTKYRAGALFHLRESGIFQAR